MHETRHLHYFDSEIYFTQSGDSIQLYCACGEVRSFDPDAPEDAPEPQKPVIQ